VGAWANPTTTEFGSGKTLGWSWEGHFSIDLEGPLPCMAFNSRLIFQLELVNQHCPITNLVSHECTQDG